MSKTKEDHRRRLRSGLACISSLILLATGVRAAGVAVLKEQPYHRDGSAKAVAYRKILTYGPYLRLVTYRGNLDINPSKLADYIEFPGPPPAILMDEDDLAPLRHSLAAMRRFASRYPASTSLLQPEVDVVSGYVQRFKTGEVRFDGKWIAKAEIRDLLESRRLEAEAGRRRDAEQVIADQARRDMGLVRINGTWVSKNEAVEQSPAARTQLSDTLWPLLINPDMDGARRALENLSALAAGQTGAAKVRTERLRTVIRNLFLTESRIKQQQIATTAAEVRAARYERQAEEWLKPNTFGTERKEAARESLAKALDLRHSAAKELETRRAELLDQMRDADTVTGDFHKLREHRVVVALGETVRAVAKRCIPDGGFQSTFPDESLAAIRREISPRK